MCDIARLAQDASCVKYLKWDFVDKVNEDIKLKCPFLTTLTAISPVDTYMLVRLI